MPLALILSELIEGTLTAAAAIAAVQALGFNIDPRSSAGQVISFIQSLIGGSSVPVCNPTHHVSSLAQGPGKCCAAWSAAGFTAAAVGQRVAITLSNGKCAICEVKINRHGGFGFKRGKAQVPGSQVSCPTTRQGCCNLV